MYIYEDGDLRLGLRGGHCFVSHAVLRRMIPRSRGAAQTKVERYIFMGKKNFQHFRKWGEAKIEYPKGSNGERVQKLKVFGLFFLRYGFQKQHF